MKLFNILRKRRKFSIVALLAVRNEELYLERCIAHLISQGIEVCIIDNDSTDRSRNIAESFLGRGVISIEHLPYEGCFELEKQLEFKEALCRQIDADWFIHQDADEIREAPPPFRTLREGIMHVDRLGYNAINFDEFVFVPTDDNESFEGRDYVAEMRYYYYFQKAKKKRHIKAWRKQSCGINLPRWGGHRISFEGIKIFPENFMMRHYIVLSRRHAIEKYCNRVFSLKEIREKGWHLNRVSVIPEEIKMPPKEMLKEYHHDGVWDRSEPWKEHYFLKRKNDTFQT